MAEQRGEGHMHVRTYVLAFTYASMYTYVVALSVFASFTPLFSFLHFCSFFKKISVPLSLKIANKHISLIMQTLALLYTVSFHAEIRCEQVQLNVYYR